jgi:hypothetical protein
MRKTNNNLKLSLISKVKRGSLEMQVIQLLGELGFLVLDASFPNKYYICKPWRRIFGLDRNVQEINDEQCKHKIHMTLQRLQQKNFVIAIQDKELKKWQLSSKGQYLLDYIITLPKEDGKLRVFIFDIPEIQSRYRRWIRRELMAHEYKKLQKSVWIGTRPLTLGFLDQVREYGLWSYIHLFEVKETGTLNILNNIID